MIMNQQMAILNYLKQGKASSQAKTIRLCDCYCLNAAIDTPCKQDFDIMTHNEPNLNHRDTHARYELKAEVTV